MCCPLEYVADKQLQEDFLVMVIASIQNNNLDTSMTADRLPRDLKPNPSSLSHSGYVTRSGKRPF